jgi:hypothetical protein
MNLRWLHCFGDGGVQNQSFACNTNIGVRPMHGSFVLASDMPDVIGSEIILQLAADSPTLPAWWQFKNIGSCRQSALSVVAIPNPADVVCLDWSGEQMVIGLGAYCTVDFPCIAPPPGANAAVIKVINAVPQAGAMALSAGVEYYDFTLNVSNAKTVGTGSCGGLQRARVHRAQLDPCRGPGRPALALHQHADGAGQQLCDLAGRWHPRRRGYDRLPGRDLDATLHVGNGEVALSVTAPGHFGVTATPRPCAESRLRRALPVAATPRSSRKPRRSGVACDEEAGDRGEDHHQEEVLVADGGPAASRSTCRGTSCPWP